MKMKKEEIIIPGIGTKDRKVTIRYSKDVTTKELLRVLLDWIRYKI